MEFSGPEYWSRVAFPFSRGSSQPRDRTQVSHIAGGFFTSWATREAQEYWGGQPVPSLPEPGDLPDPGIELGSPALQADSSPAKLSGKHTHTTLFKTDKRQGCTMEHRELGSVSGEKYSISCFFFHSGKEHGKVYLPLNHFAEHLKRRQHCTSSISPVQFSPVAQSCPTLCHPMNRSMLGLPVHHKLT